MGTVDRQPPTVVRSPHVIFLRLNWVRTRAQLLKSDSDTLMRGHLAGSWASWGLSVRICRVETSRTPRGFGDKARYRVQVLGTEQGSAAGSCYFLLDFLLEVRGQVP